MSRASRQSQAKETPNPEALFGPAPKLEEVSNDTLVELLTQKEALERKIEQARREGHRDAIFKITSLIQVYGIKPHELFGELELGKGAVVRKPRVRRGPRYRNPSTGELWSGMGKPPRWYAIAEDKEALRVVENPQPVETSNTEETRFNE